MTAIAAYERTLSAALLDEVATVSGLTVHGVTDRARLHERVPTLCFSVAGHSAPPLLKGWRRAASASAAATCIHPG